MIILTSSVTSVAAHVYENYLADKNYQSVLFIDTAAEVEVGKEMGDDWWLQADLESLQKLGYNVDRYTVTGETAESVTQKCREYDILYMCGGNTLYLLEQLQLSGAFEVIQELVRGGKPYIGTSAGSQIAAPRIPLYIEDVMPEDLAGVTGFGFVDVFILPHWGSDDFKCTYLEKRLAAAYSKTELPFLILSDSQYVVSDDGKAISVIDT